MQDYGHFVDTDNLSFVDTDNLSGTDEYAQYKDDPLYVMDLDEDYYQVFEDPEYEVTGKIEYEHISGYFSEEHAEDMFECGFSP